VDLVPRSPAETAEHILRLAAAGHLTVFAGAFVSSQPPSCLPTAADLKWGWANALWGAAFPALSALPAAGQLLKTLEGSRLAQIPLELMADELLGRTHLTAGELLSFMAHASSNLNHTVLAEMLDTNMARVVTTNFDELIEACRLTPGDSSGLAKLHGTLSSPAQLAVRMSQIGRGIVSQRLRSMVNNELRHRDIVFVGYSGSDLDLGPMLNSVEASSVLWIVRPPKPGEPLEHVARELLHLSHFHPSVSKPMFCAVDANAVFADVACRLGCLRSARRGPLPGWWQTEVERHFYRAGSWRSALALARVLIISGELDAAADVCRELETEAMAAVDRAEAALQLAEAAYYLQDYAEARDSARRAAVRYQRLGACEHTARAYQILSLVAERVGKTTSWSFRYMGIVADLLHDEPRSPVRVANELNQGIWLKNRGRLDEADTVLRCALRMARAEGDLRLQTKLHASIGMLWRRKTQRAVESGDYEAARRRRKTARYHLRRSGVLAAFLGDTGSQCRTIETEIAMCLDRGTGTALSAASILLDSVEVIAARSPEPQQAGQVANLRAEWLAKSGRLRDSIVASTRALTLLTDKPQRASCLRHRADAHLQLGHVVLATDDLRAALHLDPDGPAREETRRLLRLALALKPVSSA